MVGPPSRRCAPSNSETRLRFTCILPGQVCPIAAHTVPHRQQGCTVQSTESNPRGRSRDAFGPQGSLTEADPFHPASHGIVSEWIIMQGVIVCISCLMRMQIRGLLDGAQPHNTHSGQTRGFGSGDDCSGGDRRSRSGALAILALLLQKGRIPSVAYI